MQTRKLYWLLIIFSLSVTIPACPSYKEEIIVDDAVTIMNDTGTTDPPAVGLDEVLIDLDCTDSWVSQIGGGTADIPDGQSASFDVRYGGFWIYLDIRACNVADDRCWIWFNVEMTDEGSVTLITDTADSRDVPRLDNCVQE